ncbi:peptidase domain-containing ABC transporter [Sphingomonas parva]|uniref:Peptidase domain-containing ABC transporter n=1 Tax=Sphingomonas parva TaxID=2555898 RepID=A0A4Y8ZTC9_9SPHN|nr:peptidase domain-containing ABC transporter [Sphingomonas parva]TFI59164.1 peptidase domain-containing ABC transporter [Sphingomonas parva]
MSGGIDWPWSSRVRPMLQSEAAECGLTCIAMVAAHHGHRVNVGGLRRKFPTSMKGATLAQLIDVAAELELAPRALRLDLDELGKLQLPAILHWDLNHFVVLEQVAGERATILDPAVGRRTLGLPQLSRHFTGVALELSPTAVFRPVDARVRTRLADLWTRMSGYGGAILQLIVLSLLLQATALALPFFLQLSVDEAIAQGDAGLMGLLVVGFGIVYALNAVIQALRAWVVLTLGQSMSFQLIGNVFRHLVRLPMNYFESRHVGDLMSRIGSTQPIQSILTEGLVNALIDALLAVTTLVVMALISVKLMLLVLLFTGLYIAFRFAIYPALRRRTEEEILARANEETFLLESIRAMRAIKLHVHEARRESGWRNRYADVVSARYRSQIYKIASRLVESILYAGQILFVVYVAALAIIAGEMTVGLMLAFLSYRSSFMSSATSLIDHAERWRLLHLHLDRLSDIVAEPRENVLPASPRTEILPAPGIRAEGLTFAYGPDEAPVLRDMSFHIPAGSYVAIVGASGAGKTTLMRIMLGLLTPTGGRLLVDGKPLTPATVSNWRARIAAVLQDDQLLTGTLADNIAFFDPAPDQRAIEQVAKLARIHDTIEAMPMGYQSLIGDMGAALSSGQRQRVMLARALYRDPDALFLDEGTANLDEENEQAIADMLAGLSATRVVISHRPILVERAEIVFRLIDGRMALVEDRRVRRPEALRTA